MIRSLLLACALLGFMLPSHAGFLDQEVSFSEAEVQARIDKNSAVQKPLAHGLLTLSLEEAPRIRLGETEGRATISARLIIAFLGQAPIPVDFTGTAGVRYDDEKKAFFLADPVAESVQSHALPAQYAPAARQGVTRALAGYFRNRPIYTLREDGTFQEKTARWLLRSIRIEPGRVVAVLSPV